LHESATEIDRLKLRVDARDGKIDKLEKTQREKAKDHEKLLEELKQLKEE